ncbi:MAG: TonB-dependent receptor [Gemmatimonadota bacterium]|nr:TonB-dependent receptor [Gemmatimonadota bacterium]
MFELRPRTVRKRRWKPANVVSGAAALAFALLACPLSAQTGTISGVLTNGETGEPLSNVQVSLELTGLGTLTNNQGRFLILNAPAGEREVVAQLIGFREERRTVSLGSGESALVDISMYPLAVELEGVVVTGTAIAAQKREVGNSISLVTSDELLYAGAINLEDALRGRALGVSITGASGTAGAGSDILLRGTNSVNGRNRPLIYVDGVRMPTGTLEDASGEAQEHATFLGSIREEDIDRIEIIKGPAASSLYGTDASAGVIQIFTKKGSPGAPRWTMNMQQGLQRVGHVGPSIDPTGLRVNDCTRQFNHSLEEGYHFNRDESGSLIADPGCPSSGSWLRDARVQDYSLSVRGGSEDVTYYASAGYGATEGVIDPNESEDVNVRANFTFNGFENFQINLNNFYTRRDITWIPNGDQDEGLLYNVARGDEGETPDNDDSAVLDLTQDQVVNHFNSSANVDWTPVDNMRHRLTFGLDYSNSHFITQRPWLFWNNPLGTRTVDIENRRVITLDYAGTYLFELPGNFTSTTSAGAQYNQFEHLGNRTDVEGFIGPGAKVLENAEEVTNYNEDRDATEGGGFFLQEQIGWRNRLFVNVGLRADTHSSFGREYTKDVRFTMYPKAQATYTLSDHEFWPSWWETFRLRGAYGESGEAPPADASVTIFEASSLADENNLGFIINNLANLRIGPERAKEFEGGFDASLFDGILALNGTAYYRRTFDGLINVAPAPSSGIAESIPQNVGIWDSRGIEVGLDFLVFEGFSSRVSINANYQYNHTKMVELGDPQFEQFSFNYLNRYRKDRPIPALTGKQICNPDEMGALPTYTDDDDCVLDGVEIANHPDTFFYAPSRPPHEASVGFRATLFNDFILDAFGVAQVGHWLYDDLAQELAADGLWPECWPINDAVNAGVQAEDPSLYSMYTAKEIGRCWENESTMRTGWSQLTTSGSRP